MNVSLGAQWEQFVNEKVESGRYQTASDVLRDGLRLLEQRERAFKGVSFNSKEELEQMLEAGIQQLDTGESVPGDVAVKNLRKRAATRRRAIG
ncbi:MAG TPA: type II toxin-antitoxin system ParD family antitoxin [Verrucomicrobiae bacterium]|nr:type II toxin-antitoxin system ParD family antitoxin [Verrucomicrobiae bacterium]